MSISGEIKRIEAVLNAEGKLVVQDVEPGNISDGYHTFDELYEHRHTLFLLMCRYRYDVWMSRVHFDGTSLPGWFIAGIGQEPGTQITYHLPDRLWNEAKRWCVIIDKAPKWDGHTSNDVLERLRALTVR